MFSISHTASSHVLAGVLLAIISTASHGTPAFLTESFEDPDLQFDITSSAGISFETRSSDFALDGAFSLKTIPSSCLFNCFSGHRVDLTHAFTTPTWVENVSFSILEKSTTGFAWGGHWRLGVDGIFTPFVAGISNGNSTALADWITYTFPVERLASAHVVIRIEDLTTRSVTYLDDVRIELSGTMNSLPEPGPLMLSALGLLGIAGVRKRILKR